MSKIIPQIELEGKCADEWCSEEPYRDGLCFHHFVAQETAAWDDRDAERQMALEGAGYIFGDLAREVLA